jgi:chromosome segregation ATPase
VRTLSELRNLQVDSAKKVAVALNEALTVSRTLTVDEEIPEDFEAFMLWFGDRFKMEVAMAVASDKQEKDVLSQIRALQTRFDKVNKERLNHKHEVYSLKKKLSKLNKELNEFRKIHSGRVCDAIQSFECRIKNGERVVQGLRDELESEREKVLKMEARDVGLTLGNANASRKIHSLESKVEYLEKCKAELHDRYVEKIGRERDLDIDCEELMQRLEVQEERLKDNDRRWQDVVSSLEAELSEKTRLAAFLESKVIELGVVS